jgi:energy-coupling factor transport system ATP-binding protein
LTAIAAALAMQPQILLLDEPTASLDGPGSQAVHDALYALNARHGVTVILVEHRLPPQLEKIDRAILMETGRIVGDGEPRRLLEDATRQTRLGLRPSSKKGFRSWPALMAAKKAAAHRSANAGAANGVSGNGRADKDAPPLLRFHQVQAGHGAEPILKDVSFSLEAGEFAALVGANGAGKSTLALTAAGLLKPDRGEVIFRGGERPRPGRDVALLFQNPAEQLFTDSVEEEVAFGPQNYAAFQPDFHRATLAAADLLTLRRRHPAHLSQGQQQRTAVAACAAMRPQLLILDEPTMGQDWLHLRQIMDFAVALQEQGTAILLISHDYDLVNRYAKRILLMEAGKIKE